MYQVGTQAGNANTERQGTGYATVPDSQLIDTALLNRDAERRRQEQADRQRVLAAHKAMTDFDPEHWYRHDAEVQGLIGQYIERGGQLTAKQIDPYASTDPESIEFQKFGKKVQAYADASKQTREEWAKLQTLYNTKEGRDKIENWDEIAQYYSNPSIVDIVDNKKVPPTPRFRQPLTDSYGAIVNTLKEWNAASKKEVMGRDDANILAAQFLANPVNTEGAGGGPAGMVRQNYNSLPDEDKRAMENRGKRAGVDGLTYFLGQQMYSMRSGQIRLDDEAAKIGRNAELSKSTIENGDVTTMSERYKGGDVAIRRQVRTMVLTNVGQVDRDVDNGLYGNPDNSQEQNTKAAEDYYFKIAKSNIPSNYSRTVDEGRVSSAKETEAAFASWYNDVRSGDSAKFLKAAPYLDKEKLARFVPDMPKDSRIGNIKYYNDGTMKVVVVDEDGGTELERTLRIGDIPEEMLKNAYMDQYGDTKRNYKTSETGKQQPNQQKPPMKVGAADDI